jgi:diguanylate cyclase (GGDEF)-like protein
MRVDVGSLLVPGAIRAEYQPIVRLDDGAVVGYEALARAAVAGSPAAWLAAAEAEGRRGDLERACLDAAADNGAPPGDALLFVNVSPALLVGHDLAEARQRLSPRLVVELTEQQAVEDYDLLRRHLQTWADDGVRLAIDDTGAGHSSLRHVLELSPDFLKLDRSLVHGVHRDRKLQALVRSMVAFAAELGSAVVAEGIEQPAELEELRRAGVHLGQGWLFGRPAPPWAAAAVVPAPAAAVPTPDRRARARALVTLTDALGRAADARAACDAACAHLRRHGELMPSVYLLRDGLLRCQAQRGYWQIMDGFPLDVGLLGRCVSSGERISVGEVGSVVDFVAAVPGIAAEILVPLRLDGEVVGVLSVESAVSIPRPAEALVDAVAALLEERLGVVGLPAADSALARLARTSHALAGVADGPELRRLVVATACEVGQTSSAMLAECDPDDGALVVTAATGPLANAFAAMDADALGMLSASVDRVRSCYTAADPTGRTPRGSETLRTAGARFVAVLPLVSLGRRRGVLVLADAREMAPSTDVVEALELLGAEAARSLDLAAVVSELRARAAQDPLTGLGNHSSLHEALAASTRPHRAAVVVADIDGFKPVNDSHGHLVGDRVLRALGAALRGVVRDGDRLFRMGGDEFAAVLADGGVRSGVDVGERLRAAAARVLAPYGAGLSVGVAERLPGETATEWLSRADRALYLAKRAGTGIVVAGAHPADDDAESGRRQLRPRRPAAEVRL